MPGPSKRLRSVGGTPAGGQAKRPKQGGQPSYARVAREGLQVAIVCEDYPKTQVTKENFVDIQHAIGRLVDELPDEGFTPELVDSYWSKGAAILVCHDDLTKHWMAAKTPLMQAWEGCRLKMVELDALLTYRRVVAWFPGPVEDTEQNFSRLRCLNRGLETGYWRVYERREEPHGVCLVLSIDSASLIVLERLRWGPFNSVGQAVFPLWALSRRGRNKKIQSGGGRGGGGQTKYREYHFF